MRIVLNGVETNNKGAELMLYAILQEIERRFPDATVMLPSTNILQGYDYVKTNLNFRDLPNSKIIKTLRALHVVGILNRLKLQYFQFTEFRRVKKADYFIDGSGFAFSDQWHHKEPYYNSWKYRLDYYAKKGTKIVFLPQAFGPIEEPVTKKLVRLLSEKATLIFPREQKSLDYLVKSNVALDKLRLATDFTSLVKGIVPAKYEYLTGKVCVIPNIRLIDKGSIKLDSYLNLMQIIIETIRAGGYGVYLLNHEGKDDEVLCNQVKNKVGDVEVVTGLNALEVKGLISTSYLCITSRFHGLASALNSNVPSLSLGWSHKYEELYKDYGIDNCMLNIEDIDGIKNKIEFLLDSKNNLIMRRKLQEINPKIQKQVEKMWDAIWKTSSSIKSN